MNKLTGEPRKPNVKLDHKQFAKEYIKQGMNGIRAVQALDKTADSPTAAVRSTRMLKKDNVKTEIQLLLDKAQITPEKAIQPFADALKANKTYSTKDELIESDIPDYTVRMTAGKQALSLLGIGNNSSPSVQFNTYVVDQRNQYSL